MSWGFFFSAAPANPYIRFTAVPAIYSVIQLRLNPNSDVAGTLGRGSKLEKCEEQEERKAEDRES